MSVTLFGRTRLLLAGLIACLAVLGVYPPARAQASPAVTGTWGSAIEMPGTAALEEAGGQTSATAVSCTSAGNCSAGGYYFEGPASDGGSIIHAFAANEVNGVWHNAVRVAGPSTGSGTHESIRQLSCASAGNCVAAGEYGDAAGNSQAFAVSEVNGTWRAAQALPGLATLNAGGDVSVYALSCPSAGNCAVGGSYRDAADHYQAFVANEVSGTWRPAKQVPGTAALNAGGAEITSVSCAKPGTCAAVGSYVDTAGHSQGFVANEVSGTWGTAKEAPGTATLNGGQAYLSSVSCRSAGNCSAGGNYTDASGQGQSLVINEVSGTWRAAKPVPGLAALNTGGQANLVSVSCVSAGNCTAGGSYKGASGTQAFVVDEKGGTWKTALQVAGSATLNAGGEAEIDAVSCSSTGLCSAGGYYTDGTGHGQALVVDRVNGAWGSAQEVPGTAALNSGYGGLWALSCGSGGTCSGVGSYTDASNLPQAFVASRG